MHGTWIRFINVSLLVVQRGLRSHTCMKYQYMNSATRTEIYFISGMSVYESPKRSEMSYLYGMSHQLVHEDNCLPDVGVQSYCDKIG